MIAPMSDALVEDILELAKRLADEASSIALSRAARIHPSQIKRKADKSVVTETDHAIQAHILNAIADTYPDHGVCAEEALARPEAHPQAAQAQYCWVVDPLDGTRNYTTTFPCFSTSIAVLHEGRPIVGVVREHNLGHVYTAVVGSGATLNDTPLRIVDLPADSDILVGIPTSKDALSVSVLRSWVATRGLIFRNLGSTAFHLGLVASGALTATFCRRAKIWDVAAGALLVTEAGGCVTDLRGADLAPFDLGADPNADLPFLAAAPKTHERLLASIQAIASD